MDERDRTQLEMLRLEMKGTLDRLNDSVRNLDSKFEDHAKREELRYIDHENRICSSERWKAAIPITALVLVITGLGALLAR
jgi:hypothetical protein